jgi:hypothetical protein
MLQDRRPKHAAEHATVTHGRCRGLQATLRRASYRCIFAEHDLCYSLDEICNELSHVYIFKCIFEGKVTSPI